MPAEEKLNVSLDTQELTGSNAVQNPLWQADIQWLDIREDKALVQLLLTPLDATDNLAIANLATANLSAYRTTRFYQKTSAGWQQTSLIADFWGPPQSLETEQFTFHFKERDADVVAAVATSIDALYSQMRTSVGLPTPPSNEKLTIDIRITDMPADNLNIRITGDTLTIQSPALAAAPTHVSEEDILYQAVAIQLAQYTVNQLTHDVLLKGTSEHEVWWPILRGLRLWLIWEAEGVLATTKQEIVGWILRDPSAMVGLRGPYLPTSYDQICQLSTIWIWHRSPVAIGIPFTCTDVDQINWYYPRPSLHLRDLDGPMLDIYEPEYRSRSHPGSAVAMATLFEYIADEYGEEQLPILLGEVHKNVTWYSLVRHTLGLPEEEFEAGWHDYLVEEYGITLE